MSFKMQTFGLEYQWIRLANRASRKVNLGWLLETARLPMVSLSLLLALLVLRVRYVAEEVDWLQLVAAGALSFVVVGVVCWTWIQLTNATFSSLVNC